MNQLVHFPPRLNNLLITYAPHCSSKLSWYLRHIGLIVTCQYGTCLWNGIYRVLRVLNTRGQILSSMTEYLTSVTEVKAKSQPKRRAPLLNNLTYFCHLTLPLGYLQLGPFISARPFGLAFILKAYFVRLCLYHACDHELTTMSILSLFLRGADPDETDVWAMNQIIYVLIRNSIFPHS